MPKISQAGGKARYARTKNELGGRRLLVVYGRKRAITCLVSNPANGSTFNTALSVLVAGLGVLALVFCVIGFWFPTAVHLFG